MLAIKTKSKYKIANCNVPGIYAKLPENEELNWFIIVIEILSYKQKFYYFT